MTQIAPMAPREAWGYAAQWGSFVRAGDPGACMYGFDEKFRVQSEKHRADCLAQVAENRTTVLANPEHYDADEIAKLDSLAEALRISKAQDALPSDAKPLIIEIFPREPRASMYLADGGELRGSVHESDVLDCAAGGNVESACAYLRDQVGVEFRIVARNKAGKMAYAFDTLGYAKRLTAAGVSRSHAEAHAEAARDFVMADLVTREDLRLALDAQSSKLTIRLGTMIGAAVAILAAVVKLI